MVTWKEIYSRSLEHANYLYVSGELDKLEKQLMVMEGQIFDDEALAELKAFTEKVEVSYQQQLAAIDAEAQARTNPVDKRTIYQDVDRVILWRLEQILRHHQHLARRYSLIPSGT